MNITPFTMPPAASEMRPAERRAQTTGDGLNGFGRMLSSALDDARDKKVAADDAARNLTLGRDADIHGTMIAMEKADISFQFLMQVRNKIISAYETIMRTQV